jgi:pimeloyl-ACP methyl ester carboxylesterase
MPTLVIWGGEDRLLPPEHGRRLAALIPGARVEILDGVGHVVPLEAPGAFARLVADFALASTGGPS